MRKRRLLSVHAIGTASLALAMVGASAPATQAKPGTASLSSDETAGLTQITDAYLQRRADAVTTTGVQRSLRAAPAGTTAALAVELEDDFSALAEQGRILQGVNGGYTRAEVEVTPGESKVEGDTATLEVIEDTRLYYPDVQEGDPEYEEYSLPHSLKFNRTPDGQWLLADDQAQVDTTGPAPSTQITEPLDATAEPDSEDEGPKPPAASTVQPMDTSVEEKAVMAAGYNYGKMASYADKHWRNTNSDYRVYGNDCTNFISQAMRAGGWRATSGSVASRRDNRKWFYASHTWNTSYTWAGAENWYWFAAKHSDRTRVLNNIWQMQRSDVLQADWKKDGIIDHTMIVTKRSANEIYMTYHTPSIHNKKLSTIRAQYPRAAWYAHRT
ncbi:amidase domain-containing protein [Streptomyces agglomeratus]|uniref:amidase domain-containing protein n=2 Tax=Streptomyces agglomeratus TaxID=285458 RepID=UPI0009A05D11|nr:amidase domain-containing protein [Streptomyces agglomeratus]